MMGGGMMGGSTFGGFGTFGLIGMILNLVVTVGIIIGIVLLAIWLVRRLGETGSPASLTNSNASEAGSPKGIAQLRYARGEITRDQYQEILTDLG